MSETKFTPGPWKFYELPHYDGLHTGYIRPEEEDGLEISHHGDMGRTGEENLANANLIAAAPEMYEALKVMLADESFAELCEGIGEKPQWYVLAEKALAKADGK